MSVNPNDPVKGSERLSPDELAQRVARHLRTDEQAPRRRVFDVVSLSRIAAVFGLLLLGVGVAVAVPWVGRLAGYETAGVVVTAAPIAACPGEPPMSRLILGDTVRVLGVTEDGQFLALRDGRGPGNVVYVEAAAVGDLVEPERLPIRECEPRELDRILAAPGTTTPVAESTSSIVGTTTTVEIPSEPTTTTEPGVVGRPPRRGTAGPGTTPSPVPTGPTTPTTIPAGASPTTQPPAGTTTTTRPPATTTTRPGTTTTTSTTTTTTTAPTTTTTEATTTTTEATTTTEPTTTTTEPETTTIP
jgi:hypothetical protein